MNTHALVSAFRTLLAWIRLRPLLSVFIGSLIGLTAGVFGMLDASHQWEALGVLCAIAAAWAVCFCRDVRRLGALLLLTVSMSASAENLPQFSPPQAQEPFQPAWVPMTVGVVVIVVGGVATVCLVRFCRKHFTPPPASTNAPPAEPFLPSDVPLPDSAGVICYSTLSCWTPDSEEQDPHAFNLEAIVEWHVTGPEARLTAVSHLTDAQMLSLDAFNAALAEHGVQWTGRVGEPQFALGGVAVTADQVPFRLGAPWEASVVLQPDREQVPVVLETSNSLDPSAFWTPVVRTSVPAGTRIAFQDSPAGQQNFYRVRIGQ